MPMKTNRSLSTPARGTIAALFLLSTIGLLATAQAFAQGASISELMEQGIYSEETKGDLDAAMKAYGQVVADSKANEALAAQAQYRLGVCHYKKKDYTKATAAFEKLVKDYPNQKELVVKANEYLAGAVALLPAPWVDGEELRMDVRLGGGLKLGTARYTVDAADLDGRKIWRLTSYLFAGIQQLSTVEVEADSFKPIHCRWKHTLVGDSETTYAPGKAEVKLKGKNEVKTVELEGVFFDNEECLALMRRLPLTTNYSTTVQLFVGLTGGNTLPIKLDVTALETVKVPAGTFECYKVELNIKQTFWYSADEHRYLVKFEAGGVVAELAEIRQRNPTEPATYRDSMLSISAPAGWLFFAQKTIENDKRARLVILDPDAMADTALSTRGLDDLKPEEKKSLRAVADKAVAEATRTVKKFQVRPDSWTETTLSGRPALSVTADFTDGDDSKIALGVFTLAGDNAVEIHTHVKAQDFESFRPKFEAILKSLKLN